MFKKILNWCVYRRLSISLVHWCFLSSHEQYNKRKASSTTRYCSKMFLLCWRVRLKLFPVQDLANEKYLRIPQCIKACMLVSNKRNAYIFCLMQEVDSLFYCFNIKCIYDFFAMVINFQPQGRKKLTITYTIKVIIDE